MRRLLPLLAVLALLASGCEIRARSLMKVAESGAGTVSFTFGADREAREHLPGLEDDPFVWLEDLPEPWEVEESADEAEYGTNSNPEDPFRGRRAELAFDTLEELRAGMEDFIAAQPVPWIRSWEVREQGDTFVFEAVVTTQVPDELRTAAAEALNPFRGHIEVSMPGEVDESNADHTIASGSLEWEFETLGEERTLFATSTVGPDLAIAMVILGAGVLAAAVGGGLYLNVRRRQRAGAGAGTAAPADRAARDR